MAIRKIDRKELATVIQEYFKWLESKGEVGKKADLCGCDCRVKNGSY